LCYFLQKLSGEISLVTYQAGFVLLFIESFHIFWSRIRIIMSLIFNYLRKNSAISDSFFLLSQKWWVIKDDPYLIQITTMTVSD
jgi:hypothetical protein